MGKQTDINHSLRVMEFLEGCTYPEVLQQLTRFGFSREAWDEGWSLLKLASAARLSAGEAWQPPPKKKNSVQTVDAWENLWFPIVEATLAHRFPQLHATVFANLGQHHDRTVLITTSILVERIEELSKSEEGRAALHLLAERGFTAKVRDQLRAHINDFLALDVSASAATEHEELEELEEQASQAQAHLWAWYLEWSKIARSVITERRALAALGFKPRGRPRKDASQEAKPAPQESAAQESAAQESAAQESAAQESAAQD